MKLEEYNKIFECLEQLRSEINIDAIPKTEEKEKTPSPEVDIIKLTADKINQGTINVYLTEEVNWEEVTMFDPSNICRLLDLVENRWIDKVADAITDAIDKLYIGKWISFNPVVHSQYYTPSEATLRQRGDWGEFEEITEYADSVKRTREKAATFAKEQKKQVVVLPPNPLDNYIFVNQGEEITSGKSNDKKELLRKIAQLEMKVSTQSDIIQKLQIEKDKLVSSGVEVPAEDEIEENTKISAANLIIFFDALNSLFKAKDNELETIRKQLDIDHERMKIVPVSVENPEKEKWVTVIASILGIQPKSVGNKFTPILDSNNEKDEKHKKNAAKKTVSWIKSVLPEVASKITEIYELDN